MTDDRTAAVPNPDELSDKERAVLEAVAERPTATQQELADALGVSRATISKRANGIEGFDWQQRVAFVDSYFDDAPMPLSADGRGDPPEERADVVGNGNGPNADRTAPKPGDRASTGTGPGSRDPTETDEAASLEALADRIDAIENRLDDVESATTAGGRFGDPGLAHKVVHACMNSDHFSEDEELQVIAAVLSGEQTA